MESQATEGIGRRLAGRSRIQAESPGAGQGSTFTVKFPEMPGTDGCQPHPPKPVRPAERITVVASPASRRN